jgi:uncharacterized protein (TIGR02246 family)
MSRQFFVLAVITACNAPAREAGPADPAIRSEVLAAMERYQVAARTVNPDSIASLYTETAMLFEPGITPIQGRDAIRAFIASFPGVRVEIATASPDTIEVFGNTALYWGSYFERLTFPGQPQSEQHGKFVAELVRQTDGRWLLHRLFRIPIPSPRPAARP